MSRDVDCRRVLLAGTVDAARACLWSATKDDGWWCWVCSDALGETDVGKLGEDAWQEAGERGVEG